MSESKEPGKIGGGESGSESVSVLLYLRKIESWQTSGRHLGTKKKLSKTNFTCGFHI
jgi:hypothetical protein